MSSSPSRSPLPAAMADCRAVPEPFTTGPFPYDSIAPNSASLAPLLGPFRGSANAASSDMAACDAARAQGRSEALAEARHGFDEQLNRERAAVAAALAHFTRDRATYFQAVEAEVVQLALSIARKILHREAQVDPLLLAGIVRVALEKIDGATGVVLRLNPQNAADWRRYLATTLDPADVPQIVEDAAQPADGCVLETSMGTAALGLDVQLKEIEQGLTDLLATRPRGER